MPNYDFRSLSSQDFEELTRDLLQAEWKVALEAFKAGRDQGIDLRYSPLGGGKTIVQCKHFIGSGFAKLLAHLRDQEKPKIKALRPDRYVVVTSVSLSVANKDAIVRALHPFVLSKSDVVGAEDLEGLRSVDALITRWNSSIPDFAPATTLVTRIPQSEWYLAHGGRLLARKLIDGLLSNLEFANASDWLSIVSLREHALD
jgi:hypothetical protein